MNITSLDHIQLAMPAGQEEQARQFYADLLGFLEIPKPKTLASRGGCWFGAESIQIHLGVEVDFKPARKAHPAFSVHDLEQLANKLQDSGFDVINDASVPEVRRFFTSDPFGNRIEFIQEGDRFPAGP